MIRGLLRLAALAAALGSAPANAADWAAGKLTYNGNCIGCHHVSYANRSAGDFPAGAAATSIQSRIDNPQSTMGMTAALAGFKKANCPSPDGVCPAIANVAAYLAAPDLVRASPDSLTFGDALVGGATASTSVVLTSGGNLDVTVNQAAVTPDPAGEFTVNANSCLQLKEDQPCTVALGFMPRAIHAPGQATLTFSHKTSTASAIATTTVAIAVGAGLDPLQISSKAVAFTSQLGISSAQSLTLRNASPTAVTLTDVKVGAASGAAATYAVDPSSTCSRNASLAGGGSCTLVLTFVPTAVGSSTAVASLSYLGSGVDISLTGQGSDATLLFGAVTPPLVSLVGHASATSTVRVTNTGTAETQLGTPLIIFGSDFTILHGNAPAGVPDCDNLRLPGRGAGQCQILLQYESNLVWTGERAFVGVPLDNATVNEFMVTGASLELGTTPAALALVAPPATVTTMPLVLGNPSGTGTFLGPVDTFGSPAGFSVASNGCQPTLGPQASCVLQIRYAPTASAQVAGLLKFPYGPTAATNTAQALFVKVIGSAQPAPFASTSPAVLRFGPTTPGQSGLSTVTLSNLGSAVLNIASAVIDGAGAADFAIIATSCPASLAQGASCNMQVRFKPVAWRSNPARLVITHDAPGAQSTVSLTGQPWAGMTPDRFDFGQVLLGASSAVKTATLTNSGNLDLNIVTLQIVGDADGAFVDVQSTCQAPSTLAPGASCLVARRFAPTAAGARNALVQISHSATGGQVTLALSGTGDPPPTPDLQATPDSVDFPSGRIGVAGQPVSIDLRNTGTGPLHIVGIAVKGGEAADFATDGRCQPGIPLSVGGACMISAVFTPSLVGASAAQLVIDSDASRGRVDIALRGNADAASQGSLGVSTSGLDFGTRQIGGLPAEGRIAFGNLGDAAVGVHGVTITGAGFTGSATCGGSLPPAARCDIALRFDPQGDQVDAVGQVAIDSDASGSPTRIALSGRGSFTPAASLAWPPGSAGDLDFGNVAIGGQSQASRLQLMNMGQAPVHVQDVVIGGTSAPDFSTTSTCALRDLPPGSTCEVRVLFQPRTPGAKLASVQVLPDGAAPVGPVLTGVAPAWAGPGLVVSPNSIDLGNARPGTSSQPWFATLRNASGVDVDVQNLETNGPFAQMQSSCGVVPFVLRAGTQCQLGITFVPVASGAATGTLVVRSDTLAGGIALALRGTGSAPRSLGP